MEMDVNQGPGVQEPVEGDPQSCRDEGPLGSCRKVGDCLHRTMASADLSLTFTAVLIPCSYDRLISYVLLVPQF